jgi:hypothetical protein
VRGFDHESPMSPYAEDAVWPGVLDEVPPLPGTHLGRTGTVAVHVDELLGEVEIRERSNAMVTTVFADARNSKDSPRQHEMTRAGGGVSLATSPGVKRNLVDPR